MPVRQSARIYAGHAATVIVVLIWVISRLRHAVHRRRRPLSTADDVGIGFRGALRLRRELGLTKVVTFGGKARFMLEFPGWPSRAFSRMAGRGGCNLAVSGTGSSRHLHTAFLAITSSCPLHCRHCYERGNIGREEEVSTTRWKSVLSDVQNSGVAVVVLTGGEPMTRFDGLVEILLSGDKDLSEFHIHTSGHGVTPDRARKLRRSGLAAAGIGFDHWDKGRFDEIRGLRGAYDQAREAVRCFLDAGVFTYLNVCLTKELVRSNGLPKLLDVARELGVGIVRLMEPKPSGGYFEQESDALFTATDRQRVTEFFSRTNEAKEFRSYPLVILPTHTEAPDHLGCGMAGHSIFYIDSRGNVTPCVFLPLTFGNILVEDLPGIFKRMSEAVPRPVRAVCPAVTLAGTLRQQVEMGVGLPIPHQVVKTEFETIVAAGNTDGLDGIPISEPSVADVNRGRTKLSPCSSKGNVPIVGVFGA